MWLSNAFITGSHSKTKGHSESADLLSQSSLLSQYCLGSRFGESGWKSRSSQIFNKLFLISFQTYPKNFIKVAHNVLSNSRYVKWYVKGKLKKTNENNLSGKSKKIYQTFKCLYVKQPSCIQAWNIQYNIRFHENEWKNLFVLPLKLTKDHKLIEFQYKILDKVFASQSYVSRFDRNVPELCTKHKVRANTIHLFFKCDDVKRF